MALFVFVFTSLVSPVSAQMRASERGQVHQVINGVDIEIDYSRPSVRGRSPIWGEVEPWGTVWTPGANSATTFKFSEDVKLNGRDIEAGKYSVWFELLENDPWNLVLYTDTTMFHIPYPSTDSAHVIIEIEHEEVQEFVETLRFDIENIRLDGAMIQFRWANTMVPIELDIEPGYDMFYSAEEMAPYVGDWVLDTSMVRPSDSLVTEWRAEAQEDGREEEIDKWVSTFDVLNRVRIDYDPDTGYLQGRNKTLEEIYGPDDPYAGFILIRKGEGIFVEGGLMNGELMYVNEYKLWEFDFNDEGKADAMVQRARDDDRVMGRADRASDGH